MIPFADSITPGVIPHTYSHVAGYGNGRFEWPEAGFQAFSKYIKIAVYPGQPEQARVARCLDIERFDATVEDAPRFVQARSVIHPGDALLYCSLSTVPDLLDVMAKVPEPWGLWVAWWWQRPHPPTLADIEAELRAFGVYNLAPGLIKACQWLPGQFSGLPFDQSELYARDNFTRSKKLAA